METFCGNAAAAGFPCSRDAFVNVSCWFGALSPCFLVTATLMPRLRSAWTTTLFLPAASMATSSASGHVTR